MATDKKNEILSTYVSDVHALVSHGLQAVNRQVEQMAKVSHKDAEPAAQEFAKVLETQKTALEARLKSLGGSSTAPVKDAVSAVAGFAAGIVDKLRSSATVKGIRDDYTFFGMLNVSWLMLHTTSTSLGDSETAQLAERGYQESARMVMHIDRILPKMVVEELGEDKELSPADTSGQCVEMIKKAWNRESATL